MVSDEQPAKSKSSGRPLGPTGETVRSNIKRIRESQRIAVTELSAKMRDLGRPIPTLGIHRIEGGQRRVDVDDLVAFAVAFGVSPATLLMPYVESAADTVRVTGHPDAVAAEKAWWWITGRLPIGTGARLATFIENALPYWQARETLTALNDAVGQTRITIDELIQAAEERRSGAIKAGPSVGDD
jgi:hypothetical protein